MSNIQVTVGSSKSTLIRNKESGRLLVDTNNTTATKGSINYLLTRDLEGSNVLKEILEHMKRQTKLLESMVDVESNECL